MKEPYRHLYKKRTQRNLISEFLWAVMLVYIFTKAQNDILTHFAVMCFLNKEAEEIRTRPVNAIKDCERVPRNLVVSTIKKVPDGYTFRHFVNLDNCNYRIGNCETYIFIISDIPI